MMTPLSAQRGYATLVVSLILLVAITLITLYGARTSLMTQRILGNDKRATESFVEAERGLDEGAMFISRNIRDLSNAWVTGNRWESCGTSVELPCGDGSQNIFDANFVYYQDPDDNSKNYIAELSDDEPRRVYLVARCKDNELPLGTCDHVGPGAYQPDPDDDEDIRGSLIHTIATGTSDDATGSATIRQSHYIYQLVASPPASPLTIDAAANVSGSFEIVTNPNGGGTGVPISMWSDQPIDIGTAITTCEVGEYDLNGGSCPGSTPESLTANGDAGIDIIGEADPFPDDMFEYVFGIPTEEYNQVKDQAIAAGHLLPNCSTLDTSSNGLYWIEGACDLKVEIGSSAGPVLLVIANGQLDINAGAEVYGLVFAFDVPPAGDAGAIKLNGGALIRGGFVSDRKPTTNGAMTIYYDADLLEKLVDNETLAASGRVPGSWVDYHE